MNKAIFLDLDGTIRYSKNPSSVFINHPDDVAIFDDVIPRLEQFKGHMLIGVTNQGGVACGAMTLESLNENLARTQSLLGHMGLDAIYKATTMEKNHVMRKPNPGMIYVAAAELDIDLTKSFMVGDRPEDEGAAKAAGLEFMWAWQFFGRPQP